MKACAITMVYKDYWALSQWYAHYSKHLGSRNLYIVAHGSDAKISALCPDANVITVPRDDLSSFDKQRGYLLNNIQDRLALSYDWVVRTDADELICTDPYLYPTLNDAFAANDTHTAMFALGFDVVEAADDADFTGSESVFSKRKNVIFSGHYSKAFAVKRGVKLERHGVVSSDSSSFVMPEGVYLAHLKYANVEALQSVNVDRSLIASGAQLGLPGKAWKHADKSALQVLSSIEILPQLNWDIARSDAYAKVSNEPEMKADHGIVRARSIKFRTRTELPEWFKNI